MNTGQAGTKKFNFFELDSRERKNAISLNFGTFLQGKQGFFSDNHRQLICKVEQAREKWGLPELNFEMDLKQGFKLTAGTVSNNFYHTCKKIIRNNGTNSVLGNLAKKTELDYRWSEFFLQKQTDFKVNFRFGREQTTGMIPYGTIEKESRDIYIKKNPHIRMISECSNQEKKEWVMKLKEQATPIEMKTLLEIEIKTRFTPDSINDELKKITQQIFLRKANERAWKFELELQREMMEWEKQMNEWTQQFCLRTELAMYLEHQKNQYKFDRVGWMKKTA